MYYNSYNEKNILIGVTGGIAGYKVIDLIKLLRNEGHEVFVIMTKERWKCFPKKILKKLPEIKLWLIFFEKILITEKF